MKAQANYCGLRGCPYTTPPDTGCRIAHCPRRGSEPTVRPGRPSYVLRDRLEGPFRIEECTMHGDNSIVVAHHERTALGNRPGETNAE